MSTNFCEAPPDEQRNLGYPDPCTILWYVTEPSTGLTQYVKADAESTTR